MNFIDLKNLQEGQRVEGYVFVKEFDKKVDMSSKAPLYGTLYHKGYEIPFKVWDSVLQQYLNNLEIEKFLVKVKGIVTKYKNKLEVQIDQMYELITSGYEEYVYKSYDLDKLVKDFSAFVNTMDEEYKEVLRVILFPIWDTFVRSWCASKMHDACVGGLLAHTLKMLNIARVVVENDVRWQDKKGLIYLGIILHDIGKIYEMNNGSYTDISFVTHRVLGVELVTSHKDLILEKLGEENYYHLLAIISQHHDEYAERATTIYSKLIHYIDMLESFATGMMDRIENGQYEVQGNRKTIWVNEGRLLF